MPRPTSAARGYDYAHQKRRRRAAREIARGGVNCWRCGKPIPPDTPPDQWDLGHDDHDRSITRGPEHIGCNRSTSSRKPQRKRPEQKHPGLID